MPAVQTTYTQYPARAVAGMVDDSELFNIITGVLSVATIGFGKVVVQGASEKLVKPSAASALFRGITTLDLTKDFGTADTFAIGDNVPIMTKGVIWVTASVAVAIGDSAYYVPATGVITNVSTSNTAIPNAFFDSATSGSGLARLRIN